MMTAPATECFVSAVSFREIAIKAGLRRDEFRVGVAKLVAGARAAGLKLLAFQPEHAVHVARLEKHHSDPFDRALVAQALTEPLILVARDAALAPYGGAVIVVQLVAHAEPHEPAVWGRRG